MKKNLLLTLFILFIVHESNAQVPQLWGFGSNGGQHGDGAILKINGDGTGFASVCSLNGTTGNFPGGHLIYNGDKMIYGMAFNGGAHNSGVLFKIDPATNTYSDLYDIDSIGSAWTNSDLVRANDSTFYGLIFTGGDDQFGQLFSFNPVSKAYSVLWHFTPATGARPRNFMMASNNKLFGTTDTGGVNGSGTLFSYDPATHTFADLFDFDSTLATGSLLQASDGKIYGLTSGGGVASWGTIYSYDPAYSMYIKLHDFDIMAYPSWINGLTETTSGVLYGMAINGGANGLGAIFRFNTADNIYKKMYDFTASSGNTPVSTLLYASDGKLYGMTTEGGAYSDGTIFSFNPADSTFSKLKDLTGPTGDSPYGGLIEVPATTGIAEQILADEIQLYPNPVTDQLVLHVSTLHSNYALTVSIMNTLGEVMTIERRVGENNLVFDTKRFSTGIYIIQLTSETSRWTGKFVKE